jgi:predicted type IV restriction endonuclease
MGQTWTERRGPNSGDLPMTGTPDNELGESQNSQLATAIGEVASRIERYRGQRIGEQDTKAALIVPLLRALGWDVENLDEVRLEYKRRPTDRPVDYCLLLRDPVLFVEAKALDESLGDHRWTNQVISYAAVAGVEWVALTNGDEWRLYNAGAPVPAEEKLFRTVHVSENPDEAARTLALLKREDLRTKSLTQLWRSDARGCARGRCRRTTLLT